MTTLNDQYVAFADGENRKAIKVRRACNRCFGSQVSVRELPSIDVVSPRGTVHKAREGQPNLTDCGVVFGPRWWTRS